MPMIDRDKNASLNFVFPYPFDAKELQTLYQNF
jgi:hypothetical protein